MSPKWKVIQKWEAGRGQEEEERERPTFEHLDTAVPKAELSLDYRLWKQINFPVFFSLFFLDVY